MSSFLFRSCVFFIFFPFMFPVLLWNLPLLSFQPLHFLPLCFLFSLIICPPSLDPPVSCYLSLLLCIVICASPPLCASSYLIFCVLSSSLISSFILIGFPGLLDNCLLTDFCLCLAPVGFLCLDWLIFVYRTPFWLVNLTFVWTLNLVWSRAFESCFLWSTRRNKHHE